MKLIIALLVFTSVGVSQTWYKGEAVAVGGEDIPIAKLRRQALTKARVSALEQAGISIQASATSVKADVQNELIDIYGAFAQSTARGIIIKERNIVYANSLTEKNGATIIEVKAAMEALIDIPEGKPDYTFTVTLKTNKQFYTEGDELGLEIESSKDGYLSVFQIRNDSCFILHPHPLIPKSSENRIAANLPVTIPPTGEAYTFELDLEGGDGTTATEFIVAVVTREHYPIGGIRNAKKYFTLEEYNQWLMKTPVGERSSSNAAIAITSK